MLTTPFVKHFWLSVPPASLTIHSPFSVGSNLKANVDPSREVGTMRFRTVFFRSLRRWIVTPQIFVVEIRLIPVATRKELI